MLGQQIKYYRQMKNIKQEELADYLGVSFQAVSKWETGASDPDISLLPKLAVFFGISIDELFEMPYEEQMERIENMFFSEERISEETFRRTVGFLENTLKDKPKDTRALANMAYLYNHRAASDHRLASYYAEKVLEYDPNEKAGWVAYLEANNGVCGDEWYDNHFEVIRFFKDFLTKNPGNFQGLYAVIENMLADCRFDEAIPYIEQMKHVDKKRQYMYELYMGDVSFGKGDHAGALMHWEKMVREFPNTWQAHNALGEGYQKLGRLDEALEEFEKSFVIQEKPRLWDGLAAMAQIHEERKEYAKAIEDYERILSCLKEEHQIKEGEEIDSKLREITRLRKMAGNS